MLKPPLRVKAGVVQDGVQPVMFFALGIAYMVFARWGIRARWTSGLDPAEDRLKQTLHDDGLAIDLGARRLTVAEETGILRDLMTCLEPLGFDVVLHGKGAKRHFHLEYQPRPGEAWQVTV
jgi:hypothetical protein